VEKEKGGAELRKVKKEKMKNERRTHAKSQSLGDSKQPGIRGEP